MKAKARRLMQTIRKAQEARAQITKDRIRLHIDQQYDLESISTMSEAKQALAEYREAARLD